MLHPELGLEVLFFARKCLSSKDPSFTKITLVAVAGAGVCLAFFPFKCRFGVSRPLAD
jgi:hypothetical protein